VALTQEAWETEKKRRELEYAAALKAAEEHNERIKPAIQTAELAAQELHRVTAFLAVVRACAAKASLGVNYIPGTPNLDRVVEMATLTSALEAAYPELADPGNEGSLAQCEVVAWPQEPWTTKAPRGVSAEAWSRKARAALAQIQTIQNSPMDPGAVSGSVIGAVSGKKLRPKSACSTCRPHCHGTPSVGGLQFGSSDAVTGSGTQLDVKGGLCLDNSMISFGQNATAVGAARRLGTSKGTCACVLLRLVSLPSLSQMHLQTWNAGSGVFNNDCLSPLQRE
jgi:hypothetical protein